MKLILLKENVVWKISLYRRQKLIATLLLSICFLGIDICIYTYIITIQIFMILSLGIFSSILFNLQYDCNQHIFIHDQMHRGVKYGKIYNLIICVSKTDAVSKNHCFISLEYRYYIICSDLIHNHSYYYH